eukprot:2650350-Amphidinium_carterae.2
MVVLPIPRSVVHSTMLRLRCGIPLCVILNQIHCSDFPRNHCCSDPNPELLARGSTGLAVSGIRTSPKA